MTSEEKKKNNQASQGVRAQRIRDAFPMDDLTPEPKRQKQALPIQDENETKKPIFNESEAISEISFTDTPSKEKNEQIEQPIIPLQNEKEKSDALIIDTETAKTADDAEKTAVETAAKEIEAAQTEDDDDFLPEIVLTANKYAPAQPKKKAQKEKKKKEISKEERTERIITIRPRAHRPSKAQEKRTPFKELPFVQKSLAFAQEYKKELPHNYLLFAPFLPLGICVLLVLFRILYSIAAPTTGANIYACVAVINIIAFLPLCTVYLRNRPLLSDRLGWRLPSADKIPLMLLAAVTLFFGSAALTSLGAYFGITDFRYHIFTFYDIPATTSIAGILFSTVTLALVPAFTEEILCRGIIFAEYQYDNTPLALIMSAIFSAVLQFDPSKLLVGLFCGFLLGTVRMVTNSLSASIIVHMIYNVACLFYEHFFGIMGNQLSEFLILFFLCAVFALISFFFLFGTAEKVCRTYAEEQREITVDLHTSSGVALKGSLKVAFISPTFYFVIIFYLVSSFFI